MKLTAQAWAAHALQLAVWHGREEVRVESWVRTESKVLSGVRTEILYGPG